MLSKFSILSQLPPRSDNSFCEPTKTTLDTFASDDLGPSIRGRGVLNIFITYAYAMVTALGAGAIFRNAII